MLTAVPDPSSDSHFCLKHSDLYLPDIKLLEPSEEAFNDAFLSASRILVHYLKLIESFARDSSDSLNEVWYTASMGLFRKLQHHYHSAVLLETHHDQVGSQFLFEQLRECAITLAYLLEEADKEIFRQYTEASVQQVFSLLEQTEEQLHQFPGQKGLLSLKDQLERVIFQHKDYVTATKKFNLWGPEGANTTTKREAILKLELLHDPARLLTAQVIPASWLDVQLNYADFHHSQVRSEAHTNFTNLSNAAYLCLHVSRVFLEQVVDGSIVDKESYLQEDLNTLFLWHNEAHQACSDFQGKEQAMGEHGPHGSCDN
jgi:hypothetical protein